MTGHGDDLTVDLARLLRRPETADADRFLVALSGGVDSSVLLHVLATLRQTGDITAPLAALHVNHGLSDSADLWQQHCSEACAALEVALTCVRVQIAAGDGGLEARARQARYAAFARHVGQGDVLMLAHHLDDQIETGLLRLFRGGGLQGMPASRRLGAAVLLRPLLGHHRHDLLDYAMRHNVSWIEDESNLDLVHDRNYLRHTVMPGIAERWPGLTRRLIASLERHHEARSIVESVATSDMRDCLTQETLAVDGLQGFEPLRQREILRRFVVLTSGRLGDDTRVAGTQPSNAAVDEFLRQLASKGRDSTDLRPVMTLSGFDLMTYRGRVHGVSHRFQASAEDPAVGFVGVPGADAGLPPTFAVTVAQGLGIRDFNEISFSIVVRRGGERVGSKSVKRVLAEMAIPPWLRSRIPLVYTDDQVVAIAGGPGWPMYVTPKHAANPLEPGLHLNWTPPL
jgi:tRNA(Ile)-lysidine synthase